MIFVALTVLLATGAGVLAERRTAVAQALSRHMLAAMLYVLVPLVSFTTFARLHLSLGAGAGLIIAWAAVGAAGVAAWMIGRTWLALPRPSLGALICCVVIVNTGYLGLPTSVAVLGTSALASAVAYDQVVSGPMLFLVGFAVGASFGRLTAGASRMGRAKAFLTRNPPLIAVVAGLAAGRSAAPESLVHAAHVVVYMLLPLGFFTVGVNLSAERRGEHSRLLQAPDRRVAVAVGLRLLAAPCVLALVSATAIRLPTAYLLQAAMPTGINTLIVGHAYGLDLRLIATVIVWATASAVLAALVISVL